MIINGNCRGDGAQAGRYITEIAKNERVQVLEQWEDYGYSPEENVRQAVLDFDLWSKATKGKLGLYHAQVNPHPEYDGMTDDAWSMSIDHVAEKLGLENQPRVVTLHEKEGRVHAHVIWARTDLEQNKLINISHSRIKQKEAGRELSERLYPEIEINRWPSKGKSFDRDEQQQHERKKLSVQERREAVAEDWEQARNPETFIKRLEKRGYILAEGDRRGHVLVDREGDVFNPVKDLTKTLGVKTKEFRERMGDCLDDLPSVAEAKAMQAERLEKSRGRDQANVLSWIERQEEHHEREREDLKQRHEQELKANTDAIKTWKEENRSEAVRQALQNLHEYDSDRQGQKVQRLDLERQARIQEKVKTGRYNDTDPHDRDNRELHLQDTERTGYLSLDYEKARIAAEQKASLEGRIRSFEKSPSGNLALDFDKIYRKPDKAWETFKAYYRENGANKTAREMDARPETFGKMRGSEFTETKLGSYLRRKFRPGEESDRKEAIEAARKTSRSLERKRKSIGKAKAELAAHEQTLSQFMATERIERKALLVDLAVAAKGLSREEWKNLDEWQKLQIKAARDQMGTLSPDDWKAINPKRKHPQGKSPIEKKQEMERQEMAARHAENIRIIREREETSIKRRQEKEREREREKLVQTMAREREKKKGRGRRLQPPGEG